MKFDTNLKTWRFWNVSLVAECSDLLRTKLLIQAFHKLSLISCEGIRCSLNQGSGSVQHIPTCLSTWARPLICITACARSQWENLVNHSAFINMIREVNWLWPTSMKADYVCARYALLQRHSKVGCSFKCSLLQVDYFSFLVWSSKISVVSKWIWSPWLDEERVSHCSCALRI